ncbi:murein DD-endopeptidase MepM/ murein hydrolase activator NlpD [Novosphingobium chloroacetimidivorans]|uniref:Murein DD-endopeptidase MepM/ murein hydrolase activator NlpD n=1 Tax=Novosphingobium chloroacetimidivorans TaxID=1428314 RepID=A0A7W7NWJ0_9SPHN|nr:M23 family metallopeptidase [Novosphingobium chloroacetimidivorans]MBB4859628.1 murein DD-endopeptidase MepM/ murein hydrolase activator NlpD [Novosphingobium chloroacetimidivorans]
MAGNAPTQLPAYIALRYEENGVFDKFQSEAERAASETKKRFNQAFSETERVVTGAVGRINSQFGKIDLGVGQFREQQAQIRLYRDALDETARAGQRLAKETGDTSVRTREYLRALTEQRAEADRALNVANAQVATYTRLQSALDAAANSSSRLAASQREVFAEQARAAREEVAARERQNLYAVGFGYDRPAKSAAASASVFENQGYKPSADLRDAVQKIRDGDAAMDRAALSGVTLEQVLGRVAGKSREVTAAVAAQARQDAEAAAENLKLAQAIDRLHAEIDPLVAIQQRYTSQVALLDEALRKGAIDAERYAAIHSRLKNTLDEGTTATRNVINSQGALRQATLQSGQQLQDIAISLYSGQQASVVFAQQLPQLAFGLSGLEGSANKAHDRIGRFATFLSGPWGIAVGLAVGVAGTLITELLGIGDEADKAAGKTYDFTRSLDVLKTKGTDAAEAMRQLAAETRSAIREQGDFLDQRAANARTNVGSLEAGLSADRKALSERQAKVGTFGLDLVGAAYNLREISRLQSEVATKTAALADARQSLVNADLATSERRVAGSIDASRKATDDYNIALGKLQILRENSAKLENNGDPLARATSNAEYISQGEYERRLTSLQKVRNAAIEAAREANKATTSLERATLLRPVEGGRITGRVGEARPGHTHAGVDIAVPVGTQVRAPAGGVVVEAGRMGAYGNVIFIDHGSGTISRLAHLSQIGVKKGDVVERGQDVGLSGNTGRSSGPHLHYEVRRGGKAVDPFGSYPTDAIGTQQKAQRLQEQAARAAEKAAREQQELADFGARSAESIQRLNERFNEQPRLVDQAAAATRNLDAIVADLEQRQPPGFEKMIADAQTAKGVVQDALVRPFEDLAKSSERRLAVQAALASGNQDKADTLQEVYRLTDTIGNLTQDQVDYVRSIVEHERERSRELQRQQALWEAQLEVVDTARRSITGMLSGRGNNPFKEITQSLKDLQGARLFDQLFGDVFDDLENELRGRSPLGKESQRFADEMSVATNVLGEFTTGLRGAIGGVAANDNSGLGPVADNASFAEAFSRMINNQSVGWDGRTLPPGVLSLAGGNSGEIVVTAKLAKPSVMDMADKIAGAMTSPLTDALSKAFGTGFGQMIGGVVQSAIAGKLTGGDTGGILGGLKGIVDQTGIFGGAGGGVSAALGGAMAGAQTGTMASGIMKSLGIKTSQTGAQIGGAIGSFIPIPGGEIIGSIAGGLLGGLFKKTKKGYANNIMIGADGDASYSTNGNSASRIKAGGEAADSLVSALDNIADQLGGGLLNTLNLGSLGMRKDKYTFDPTPGNSAGRQEFESQEEAVRAAMVYAIDKGVITGIRQSTQRLLSAGDDLDKALQDALTWENAFKELRRYKDPLGAAIDELNTEFKKLLDLGTQAGASVEEMAQLEELYGIKRNEIVKDKAKELTSSLADLLDELTVGDSGLSLRDRRANALSQYNPLKDRVAAGDTSAYDEYADAARALLDIERDLYGSQQSYFDRLNEVTALTKDRIGAETNVVSIAENRESPFDSAGKVKDSVDRQTDVLSSQLDAMNINIGNLPARIAAAIGGGSASGPAFSFSSYY